MPYKIKDLQQGTYFADGATFDTLPDVCQQLIDYHNNDCDMVAEQTLLDDGRVAECWRELEMFDWEIEEINT